MTTISKTGSAQGGRMKRAVSALVLAAVVAAPLSVTSAEARDGWRRHHHHHHHRGYDSGTVVGVGVAGLAVGALLGSALAAPPRYAPPPVTYVAPPPPPPVYYQPAPVYYQAPPPAYNAVPPAGGYPAFTAGWYSYCEARYRSFDPQSGTYLGHDGYRHYCR